MHTNSQVLWKSKLEQARVSLAFVGKGAGSIYEFPQMASFKFKLTGLEIEFDGTPDEVLQVQKSAQANLGAIIQAGMNPTQPAVAAIAATVEDVDNEEVAESREGGKSKSNATPRKRGTKMRPRRVIDMAIDPNVHGTPTQDMSTAEKALYTLYLATKIAGVDGLSNASIVATYEKYFSRSGNIRATNVSRDFNLRKYSQGPEAIVSLKPSDKGSFWMLTNKGMAAGEQIAAKLKPSE